MSDCVTVNGEKMESRQGATVVSLLEGLNVDAQTVVVELNGKVLKRAEHETSFLKDGDVLEIIHFVGGGKEAGGPKALVVVESPAKAKTINKILGHDYIVMACMGHVKDLPKSKLGVDVENGFEPEYVVPAASKKVVSALKKEALAKECLYLVTDPDREGEAISWHLSQLLQRNGLKTYRVSFNEITRDAVLEAFKHPGSLDMNKVDAQIARRVLDRIVGYEISPILWKKVCYGLSAGRVQSVALRLICEREKEIRDFKSQEYWSLEVELLKRACPRQPFAAKLDSVKGKKPSMGNKEDAGGIMESLKGKDFLVTSVKEEQKRRNPQSPYTTSKLQQEAFNRLRFPAARTMRAAQQLYEGVTLGSEGSVGLITYMRTDSVQVSNVALTEVRSYIAGNFGEKYLPKSPRFYKSRKSSQGAHEAIRPASVSRVPEKVKPFLSQDQYKIYTLIWAKFVSSQMQPAVYAIKTAEITAGDCVFKASASRLEFPGFTVAFPQSETEEKTLPPLAAGDKLELLRFLPEQHFTEPPPRYNEGSLIKTLEENGVGRPSTYVQIIRTLQKNYVSREKGVLTPTELGMKIADMLAGHFPFVVDAKFTARMEENLDEIEEGKAKRIAVLSDFHEKFKESLDLARETMQDLKKEAEKTGERCGKERTDGGGVVKCEGEMVIKWGKNGRFLSCSLYPKCKNTRPLPGQAEESQVFDKKCEKCGKPMVIKHGRMGKFLGCSGYRDEPPCTNTMPLPTGVKCPKDGCEGELVVRYSKNRGSVFYGCNRYPECKTTLRRLPKAGSEPEPSAS